MYELIQAGARTYYLNCPAKIGIYQITDQDVYLIDSGNDKDAARKVDKILKANNWNLVGIINTHSNADHIGGNQLLQKRTGCKVIAAGIERAFIEYPVLETSFLYGGYPCKELRNKFLLADATESVEAVETALPEELEPIKLGGHFFDMIGIKTPDNVYFLADCVFGENIINKYHLSFIYDVKEFLQTLDTVAALEGDLYIPAHAEATTDIKPLVELNRQKVYEILETILHICTTPINAEEVLKQICDHYHLTLDFNQYVLVGSTARSFLSYLLDEGKLERSFVDNRLLWKTI